MSVYVNPWLPLRPVSNPIWNNDRFLSVDPDRLDAIMSDCITLLLSAQAISQSLRSIEMTVWVKGISVF